MAEINGIVVGSFTATGTSDYCEVSSDGHLILYFNGAVGTIQLMEYSDAQSGLVPTGDEFTSDTAKVLEGAGTISYEIIQ